MLNGNHLERFGFSSKDSTEDGQKEKPVPVGVPFDGKGGDADNDLGGRGLDDNITTDDNAENGAGRVKDTGSEENTNGHGQNTTDSDNDTAGETGTEEKKDETDTSAEKDNDADYTRDSAGETSTDDKKDDKDEKDTTADAENKVDGEKGADDECDKKKVAVDSNGKPCLDFSTRLLKQAIYRSTNPSLPYVYCAIPKNGCTYHLGLLSRINGLADYEQGPVVHDKEMKEGISLSALDNDQIASLLVNKTVPKYLVVRNPMHRILSAYLDKVLPYIPEEKRTIDYFHNWIYAQFPKDQPVDRRWDGVNPHWTPQMEFCGFRDRDTWEHFEFFRVEEPEEYVNYLYKVIPSQYLKDGWSHEDNLSFRDHVLGPRKRTGNTNERFLRFFEKVEVFDHLAGKLVMDIDKLGYRNEVNALRSELVESLKAKDAKQE